MKSSIKFGALLAVLLTATATSSFAETLRCGTDFASIGNTKGEILEKCGEPVAKDNFCQASEPSTTSTQTRGTTVNVVPCKNVDLWTYNPGYGQFMTTLRFEEGKLVSIKYGERAH